MLTALLCVVQGALQPAVQQIPPPCLSQGAGGGPVAYQGLEVGQVKVLGSWQAPERGWMALHPPQAGKAGQPARLRHRPGIFVRDTFQARQDGERGHHSRQHDERAIYQPQLLRAEGGASPVVGVLTTGVSNQVGVHRIGIWG